MVAETNKWVMLEVEPAVWLLAVSEAQRIRSCGRPAAGGAEVPGALEFRGRPSAGALKCPGTGGGRQVMGCAAYDSEEAVQLRVKEQPRRWRSCSCSARGRARRGRARAIWSYE